MTATTMMKNMANSQNTQKKMQPGKAYRVRKPENKTSTVAAKMKHMAATCGGCHGQSFNSSSN